MRVVWLISVYLGVWHANWREGPHPHEQQHDATHRDQDRHRTDAPRGERDAYGSAHPNRQLQEGCDTPLQIVWCQFVAQRHRVDHDERCAETRQQFGDD